MVVEGLKIREEVALFAKQMELELLKNDHKHGWEKDTLAQLFQRLKEEVQEVEDELNSDCQIPILLISELADVANFAMMIHDKVSRY